MSTARASRPVANTVPDDDVSRVDAIRQDLVDNEGGAPRLMMHQCNKQCNSSNNDADDDADSRTNTNSAPTQTHEDTEHFRAGFFSAGDSTASEKNTSPQSLSRTTEVHHSKTDSQAVTGTCKTVITSPFLLSDDRAVPTSFSHGPVVSGCEKRHIMTTTMQPDQSSDSTPGQSSHWYRPVKSTYKRQYTMTATLQDHVVGTGMAARRCSVASRLLRLVAMFLLFGWLPLCVWRVANSTVDPGQSTIGETSPRQVWISSHLATKKASNINQRELAETSVELSVVDLEYVTCSSNIQSFSTYVYFDFVFSQLPSPADRATLEKSFKDTFNDLSYQVCDPMFRSVQQVEVQLFLEDGKGNTTADPATEPGPASIITTGLFNITASCRNCSVSSLFDSTFPATSQWQVYSRPQVPATSATASYSLRALPPATSQDSTVPVPNDDPFSRHLQDTGDAEEDICLCPAKPALSIVGTSTSANTTGVNNTTAELFPSVPIGFFELYSNAVDDAFLNGTICVAKSPQALQEIQIVDCSPDIQEFETFVYSDLKVDLNSFTLEQAQALESSFMNTYNRYVIQCCLCCSIVPPLNIH